MEKGGEFGRLTIAIDLTPGPSRNLLSGDAEDDDIEPVSGSSPFSGGAAVAR